MKNYIFFEELQMMKDRFYFFAEEAVMKKPEIAYHELGDGEVFKVKAGPNGAIVLPYANAATHIMIETLREYETYEDYEGEEERLFYHYHNAVEVSIVLEGEGYYFVEGRAIKVQKGAIIFINSLVPHAWIASDTHPAIQRTFTFFPTLLFDQEMNQCGNDVLHEFWEGHRVSYTQENTTAIFELWQQIYREYEMQDEGYKMIIKYLILTFLLYEVRKNRLYQNSKKKKVVHVEVEHAVNYMRHNFQRNITLEEVAKSIYMHPNYLSSLFKKTYGIPFAEYMNMLKISMATELMETTEIELEEIARQSGFSSVSNFYRVFKKVYNMSPRQYSKQSDEEVV